MAGNGKNRGNKRANNQRMNAQRQNALDVSVDALIAATADAAGSMEMIKDVVAGFGDQLAAAQQHLSGGGRPRASQQGDTSVAPNGPSPDKRPKTDGSNSSNIDVKQAAAAGRAGIGQGIGSAFRRRGKSEDGPKAPPGFYAGQPTRSKPKTTSVMAQTDEADHNHRTQN